MTDALQAALEALLKDAVPQGDEVKVSAYRLEKVREAMDKVEKENDE